MARSPGFGSDDADLSPISDSVSLRLPYSVKLANTINSLTHYTKGTQSPDCSGFHCLYAHGFRFYFTPLSGVLFAFPSRYLFTIGQQGVFSLGGWSPLVHCCTSSNRISRVPSYFSNTHTQHLSHTGLSPSTTGLSRPFC